MDLIDTTQETTVTGRDNRQKRVDDILYALQHEPMDLETANALIDELAELGIDITSNPPDEPEVGSAEWYSSIEEIEF